MCFIWLIFLPGSANNKVVFFYVFGDSCACTDETITFNVYRCNNIAVGTNKDVGTYFARIFTFAIVVCEDNSASNIAFIPNCTVSDIGKMADFCVFTNKTILYFDKIADFTSTFNITFTLVFLSARSNPLTIN